MAIQKVLAGEKIGTFGTKYNATTDEIIVSATTSGGTITFYKNDGSTFTTTVSVSGGTSSNISNDVYSYSSWSGDTISGATRQAISNKFNSIDNQLVGFLPLSGGTMTGNINFGNDIGLSGSSGGANQFYSPFNTSVATGSGPPYNNLITYVVGTGTTALPNTSSGLLQSPGDNILFSRDRSVNGVYYGSLIQTSGNGVVLGYYSDGIKLTKTSTTFYGSLFTDNLTANRNYQFPNQSGTIALTSDLSNFLPLSGGTMTGPTVYSSGITNTSSAFFTGVNSNIRQGYYSSGHMFGSAAYYLQLSGTGGQSSIAMFTNTSGNLLQYYGQNSGGSSVNMTMDDYTSGGTISFNRSGLGNDFDLRMNYSGMYVQTGGVIKFLVNPISSDTMTIRGNTSDNTSKALSVKDSSNVEYFYLRNDGEAFLNNNYIVSGTGSTITPGSPTTNGHIELIINGVSVKLMTTA